MRRRVFAVSSGSKLFAYGTIVVLGGLRVKSSSFTVMQVKSANQKLIIYVTREVLAVYEYFNS